VTPPCSFPQRRPCAGLPPDPPQRRFTETWLISGDYKRDDDPACAPFEPVRADVLIHEAPCHRSTRWQAGAERWPPRS